MTSTRTSLLNLSETSERTLSYAAARVPGRYFCSNWTSELTAAGKRAILCPIGQCPQPRLPLKIPLRGTTSPPVPAGSI